MSMTTPTNPRHHRTARAIALAIATIISFATFGAVQANATTHKPCGLGIDPTVVLRHGQWVNTWGWQYNDLPHVHTTHGDVGVWANTHGKVVGYSAYEDTNIMRTAQCAAKDL